MKNAYLLTSTKTQIYAFIVHAHFSLAEQSLDARCGKMDQCPTLSGVFYELYPCFLKVCAVSRVSCERPGHRLQESTFTVNSSLKTGSVHSKEDVLQSKSLKQWKDWMHGKSTFCFLIIFFTKHWLLGSSGPKIKPLHLICNDIKYIFKKTQTLFK